jgi:AraC-like DNA-binding protein
VQQRVVEWKAGAPEVQGTAAVVQDVRAASARAFGGDVQLVSLWLLRAVVAAFRQQHPHVDFPMLQGIDLDSIADPARGVSREVSAAVLGRIADASADPNVFLELGRSVTDGHFHFLGPLLTSQVTARRVIELLRTYHAVIGGPVWNLELSDGVARVGYAPWGLGRAAWYGAELSISVVYHGALRFWGAWAAPSLSVELALTPRLNGPDYARFFGEHVRTGARQTALVLPEALLDYQRPGADAELASRVVDYARTKYLHGEDELSWKARVESALRAAKEPSELEPDHVARRCRVSERTLRRRLAEEDTSFTDIRARVRLERAAQLLVETDMPLKDISRVLGYADCNSFRRAFRRWSGRTPPQYRTHGGRSALAGSSVEASR